MSKKTILVVDDDSLILKLVSFALPTKDFKVLEALNGKEALEVLNKHYPKVDLIITDYSMPLINGFELANAVRNHEKHKNIPLILMSSHIEIKFGAEKQYRIFDDVIQKPFTSETILQKAKALLNKK